MAALRWYDLLSQSPNDPSVELVVKAGNARGFEVEESKDYGAGPIDIVWKIPIIQPFQI